MAKKVPKTNAMRLLETAGIDYEVLTYRYDARDFDGQHVAQQTGFPAAQVFKTLVLQDKSGEVVVCCLPVDSHADLKALAGAAGCKKLDLIHPDTLQALTGYQRGGCSPVGMKKAYPLYYDRSALQWEQIAISAGMRGVQLLLSPHALFRYLGAIPGDFCATPSL